MAKHILLENAYISWIQAIGNCNKIKAGLSTLYYKKAFISSLHNAVELFMKQVMLDNNDYRLASVRDVEPDGSPEKQYLNATNLNDFFFSLDEPTRKKFYSIEFSKMIEISEKSIFPGKQFKSCLKLLNKHRNDETHFYICDDDYLPEADFIILHNFMVEFYSTIREAKLLPFTWGEPAQEDNAFVFDYKPFSENQFSYKSAIAKSTFLKYLKSKIEGELVPHGLDATCYGFAEYVYNVYGLNDYPFSEVLGYIETAAKYNLIQLKAEIQDVPEEVSAIGEQLVGYLVAVKVKS